MMELLNSSSGGGTSDSEIKVAASPAPSCVSMKSDRSMDYPPLFSSGPVAFDPENGLDEGGMRARCPMIPDENIHRLIRSMPRTQSAASPVPSCVSMKSDRSMDYPPLFSSGPVPFDPEQHTTETTLQTHKLLEDTGDLQQDSCTPLDVVLHRVLEEHKTSMKKKYESLFEGIKSQENKTLLNRIYTPLYLREGETEGVNKEQEMLQMEKTPRKQHFKDTEINCNDIFEPLCQLGFDAHIKVEREKLRSVLTKGIAGIGKTVSVQKFILDWAEGKANKDIHFMFVLPFRELNLIKNEQYNFNKLLSDFYPELKHLDLNIFNVCKVVFIFDGLDESRISLNFSECVKISDINMTSSVGLLIANLIKGELLPSAHVWITSRPAAANQIPPQYINCMTEIQGFTDSQKEEYFRKKICDQDQAKKIISHIKTAQSLPYHLPVFCWISATILQKILKQANKTEIYKTLTEMYIHFLLIQTNMTNVKYKENDERDPKKLLQSNRDMILKLSKLAFKQIFKRKEMFYEEDLRECGIDVTEASIYSGICTEMFREESVLHKRNVYCFTHVSFQEFLAAFFVFHCCVFKTLKPLQSFIMQLCEKYGQRNMYGDLFGGDPLDGFLEGKVYELLKRAVDKALKSQTGHLDLFLHFLLGISLECNQKLLQGLLTHTHRAA